MARNRKRHDLWAVISLCILGLAFQAFIFSVQGQEQIRSVMLGHNDFIQLYVGARLIGSGDVYSPGANWKLQAELIGKRAESVLYSRLPFYAVLLKPLSRLPYRIAYWIFQALSVACVLAFLWLFVPRDQGLAILTAFSIPLLATFRLGQDTTLVVLAFSAFYLLSQRGRGVSAGLALSLCLIKFHLFPAVALALFVRREWPEIRGAVLGGSGLLVLGTLGAGPAWPISYTALLRSMQLHPNPAMMPNLHGLVAQLFGGGRTAEVFAVLAVLAIFCCLIWRQPSRGLVYSAALVTGLLVSFHAYVQDALILLPAIALLKDVPGSRAELALLVLAASPFPNLMLLGDRPWNATLPLLLIATLGIALRRSVIFLPLWNRRSEGSSQ